MPPAALYTAGETPRAPRAPSLALTSDFVSVQCFWRSTYAGERRAEFFLAQAAQMEQNHQLLTLQHLLRSFEVAR